MTEDTTPAQPEGGESTSRAPRNPSRGRRFRRPPRRPRGRPGFRAEQEPRDPAEKPKEVEGNAPTPEEIEADSIPTERAEPREAFVETRSEAEDIREEMENSGSREPAEPASEQPAEATQEAIAEPAGDVEPASPKPVRGEMPRRDRPPDRRPPPRERFQPRGNNSHNQQRPPQQPAQRYEPRPPLPAPAPPPPPSVAKAIEEVKGIIEDLTEALDDMEQVLRILEDAEVQKNADEREIETLRRQLKLLHRREGGQPRHQPQGGNQGQSAPRREEQEPEA